MSARAPFIHTVCSDGWVTMRPKRWRALDELYAGTFDGMTYMEITETAPQEAAARAADKLGYRYPRGESYLDVITRIAPVIYALEQLTTPVLVIAHQGILRLIYACVFRLRFRFRFRFRFRSRFVRHMRRLLPARRASLPSLCAWTHPSLPSLRLHRATHHRRSLTATSKGCPEKTRRF